MLFNSFEFLLLFLPLALGVACLLRGQALLGWLTFVSFAFYAFAGHAWFLVPMAFTTVLDFTIAPWLEGPERRPGAWSPPARRALLVVSLTCNLGLLAYFKYGGLFARTAVMFGAPPHLALFFDVVLPAGISFYTFQTMSYVVDVYRGVCGADRNFLKFAAFVSFFPHLIAGPLTRHDQLMPQLATIADRGVKPRWQEGVFLFAIGLGKKVVVADRIAALLDPMLAGQRLGVVSGWIALVAYAMQIYFDFSGYSDMAIGLGRLFGIELPQNFDVPYQASDPSDFWRRWHITLSRWLRDYLYISLGGNRCGPRRQTFNLVVTMVLGGLWHGANWTFAVWGLYHGVLLVVFHRFEAVWQRLTPRTQRAGTFAAVCFGWLFFRSPDLHFAGRWIAALAGRSGSLGDVSAGTCVKVAALSAVAVVISARGAPASRPQALAAIGPRRQVLLGALAVASILYMGESAKFLYFQF
jgi:alginate O-acetyltransferase complex protein AlgI